MSLTRNPATSSSRCGVGSWGGQRLRMGDYVVMTGPTDEATAAGGGASVGFYEAAGRVNS
jgi:hypothetical protein